MIKSLSLHHCLLAGCLGVALTLPHPALADADYNALQSVLSNYNVYVEGNLGTSANPYSSDAQGAVAVGGNAYLENFQAGGSLPAGSTALTVQNNLTFSSGSSTGAVLVGGNATFSSVAVGTSLPANASALNVGGNLTYSNGSVNGNTTVGGTASFLTGSGTSISGNLNVDGGKPANLPSVSGSSVFGSKAAKPTAAPSITSNFAALQGASSELDSSLQAQGTLGTVSDVYGQLDLTGSGSVNYFDITASQLVGITGLDFITPTGSVNIINVTGQLPQNDVISNFGFLGNVDSATTLFNFTQATSLSFNGIGFEGSILAPDAAINAVNGNFTGTVIAASFGSTLNSDAQFNESAFVGLPQQVASVREPAAASLLLSGLAILALLRRRQMQRA